MNIQEKRSRLQKLLEHNIKNEEIGTAVAITGSWGVGKTFFWNELLNSIRENEVDNVLSKRKYAYISLFGIESLSDLKTQIYSNIENHNLPIEIPKWLKSLPSIFKDTRVTQLGINAPIKLIDNLMFNQVKDAVICFDDFERMSNKLDIKDVMGLANQLKLEKSCQIILILDETKTEEKNKEKYAEYKEKLIDETIKITSVELLIRENTKDIDNSLVDLMVKFADELEIHNFRFFQKVIRLYRVFRKQLPEEVADLTKEIIITRILQGYLIHDFQNYEYEWSDCGPQYMSDQKRGSWSDRKKQTYESLQRISYSFNNGDEWLIEFKKWFEQIDQCNFDRLNELVQSEFISENNQNIKNKIWDIFERRFNFKVTESDFIYLSNIGRDFVTNESIYNTAVAYSFLEKYLSNKKHVEKFKKDIFTTIDLDLEKSILRKQEEIRLWGHPENIFYDYIDKQSENYIKEKSLREVVSHFFQYGHFKNEDDKNSLEIFSLEDCYHYLVIDIFNEKFFIEKNETLVACLRKLYKLRINDFDVQNMIITVLNKIGEESEFNRRYMQDIIENHLE